jgi:hypothetical protein
MAKLVNASGLPGPIAICGGHSKGRLRQPTVYRFESLTPSQPHPQGIPKFPLGCRFVATPRKTVSGRVPRARVHPLI